MKQTVWILIRSQGLYPEDGFEKAEIFDDLSLAEEVASKGDLIFRSEVFLEKGQVITDPRRESLIKDLRKINQ